MPIEKFNLYYADLKMYIINKKDKSIKESSYNNPKLLRKLKTIVYNIGNHFSKNKISQFK